MWDGHKKEIPIPTLEQQKFDYEKWSIEVQTLINNIFFIQLLSNYTTLGSFELPEQSLWRLNPPAPNGGSNFYMPYIQNFRVWKEIWNLLLLRSQAKDHPCSLCQLANPCLCSLNTEGEKIKKQNTLFYRNFPFTNNLIGRNILACLLLRNARLL